jgi:myo-inositol catabolism protein IolC
MRIHPDHHKYARQEMRARQEREVERLRDQEVKRSRGHERTVEVVMGKLGLS